MNFEKAIELNPNDAWAYARRGETYRQMRQFENALMNFEKAIQYKPRYAWAYARRGETYRQMRQFENAILYLEKAIEISPWYWWAYASLGETYRQTKQYLNAIDMFNKAIEKNNKPYRWAYEKRGKTYLQMKKYEHALNDFNKLISLQKRKRYFYQRNLVYLALGQPELASQDLAKAIDLAEKRYQSGEADWEDIFDLALYYVLDDRWEDASIFYNKALTEKVSISYIVDAIDELNDFLAIYPSHKGARRALKFLELYT